MSTIEEEKTKDFAAARNACKVCTPLGSSLVFKGIRGCVPLIHGSQGCSTYIRRFLISHFKEPVDIASSNFTQHATIFGGSKNFSKSIDNLVSQYHPEVIAISSTCLSETIGEDVNLMLTEYRMANADKPTPAFVYASTPSYQGTHMDGFHEALTSIVSTFARAGEKQDWVTLLPNFVSPADIRYLKRILEDWGIKYILPSDYSDTLDNPNWSEYQLIPQGGTPVEEIEKIGSSKACIEMGYILNKGNYTGRIKDYNPNPSAGEFLAQKFDVEYYNLGIPIGIKETDKFYSILKTISGKEAPEQHRLERGRLVDSYVDGHKYVFGKKAIVYGEEDIAVALTAFLDEIGIEVVLCASGGESGNMKRVITELTGKEEIEVCEGMDFEEIADKVESLDPDIIVGNSRGYYLARKIKKPLVRVGFPIHDRIGGQRLLHVGYAGTQQLYDKIVNALIEYKQENSPVGYKYM